MVDIRQTSEFAKWLGNLRDSKVSERIKVRIRRLSLGNAGDVKQVGTTVSELRIDYSPGYPRVLHQARRRTGVLLCGGDKRTQDRDIARAKHLAQEV